MLLKKKPPVPDATTEHELVSARVREWGMFKKNLGGKKHVHANTIHFIGPPCTHGTNLVCIKCIVEWHELWYIPISPPHNNSDKKISVQRLKLVLTCKCIYINDLLCMFFFLLFICIMLLRINRRKPKTILVYKMKHDFFDHEPIGEIIFHIPLIPTRKNKRWRTTVFYTYRM